MERYAAIKSMLMIVIATFLVEVRPHADPGVETDGKNVNIAPRAGHPVNTDPQSLINMEYYNFGHVHGNEEALLDMNWDRHLHEHHDNIGHTHLDEQLPSLSSEQPLVDNDLNQFAHGHDKDVPKTDMDDLSDGQNSSVDMNPDQYEDNDKLLMKDGGMDDIYKLPGNAQNHIDEQSQDFNSGKLEDEEPSYYAESDGNDKGLVDTDLNKQVLENKEVPDYGGKAPTQLQDHMDTEDHGSSVEYKYNTYPNMQNNPEIIYGSEAGGGIAYVPVVYQIRKGKSNTPNHMSYSGTKGPARKYRKFSNYGTQSNYYQQMNM